MKPVITIAVTMVLHLSYLQVRAEPDFAYVGFGPVITGGGTTNKEVASTVEKFKELCESEGPKVIEVVGKLKNVEDVLIVNNDITIIGAKDAEIAGGVIEIKGASNIIIRNLKIHSARDSSDLMYIEDSKNIWVDRCEFYNKGIVGHKDDFDGLLDVSGECENITVSWCIFRDHWKGLLFGKSKGDDYKRKITLHHNYFKNINSRCPSVRFGTLHFFNNFLEDINGSAVNSRMDACVKAERNVFLKVKNPIFSEDDTKSGKWEVKDNVFTQCSGNQPTTGDCSADISYTYSNVFESVSTVKETVLKYAGPWKGTVDISMPKAVTPVNILTKQKAVIYNYLGEKIGNATATNIGMAGGIYIIKNGNGSTVMMKNAQK